MNIAGNLICTRQTNLSTAHCST